MESNEQQGIGQELKISQKDWMEQWISIGPVQTKKWSSSKGGPAFSKLFRLDRADPSVLDQNFWKILVEGIAPKVGPRGLCNTTTCENLYCLELWQVAI